MFGNGGHGFSLKALLEDPNLQNPPNLNSGLPDLKKGNRHGGYVSNANAAFLGANLWEKQGDNSSDLDLEYMDLDEFLSENGIPVNPAEIDDNQTISMLASALAQSPPRSPITGPASPIMINPRSPDTKGPVSPMVKEVKINKNTGVYMPESPIRQNSLSPLSFQGTSSGPVSPSAIERCLLDDNFGVKVKLPEDDDDPDWKPDDKADLDIDFKVDDSDLALVTIPVYRQNDSPPYSPEMWDDENDLDDSEPQTDNMIQNRVPGQENFDPKRRRFTDEELKPQPIIKKSRKVFVDESSKDDRYWARRKKNNIAAKRSRDARRVKENQIAMRASFLEQENDKLRVEVEKLQRDNVKLSKRLSKYETV